MIKIKIFSVGKTKETWLDEGTMEYVKRLSSTATLEFQWLKDDLALEKTLEKEKAVFCLDPQGKELTSQSFSELIETAGSRFSFVIGGPEGLTPALRKNHPLISLSRMTFTHQMARLILAEQIFRAFEILRGSPYHK